MGPGSTEGAIHAVKWLSWKEGMKRNKGERETQLEDVCELKGIQQWDEQR